MTEENRIVFEGGSDVSTRQTWTGRVLISFEDDRLYLEFFPFRNGSKMRKKSVV